jgi:prevent-host-death family protein
MRTVQVRDAKAGLSALLEDAEHGRPTMITRHGKPVAVIVPVGDAARLYGGAKTANLVEYLMMMPPGLDPADLERAPIRDVDNPFGPVAE